MSRSTFRIAPLVLCVSLSTVGLIGGFSPDAGARPLVAQEAETTEAEAKPDISKWAKFKLGKRSAASVVGRGSVELIVGGPKATVWLSRLNGATAADTEKLKSAALRMETFALTVKPPVCAALSKFLAPDYPDLPAPTNSFGFASYGIERKGCAWRIPGTDNEDITVEVSKPTDFPRFSNNLPKSRVPFS
jgi:hypothetical protein